MAPTRRPGNQPTAKPRQRKRPKRRLVLPNAGEVAHHLQRMPHPLWVGYFRGILARVPVVTFYREREAFKRRVAAELRKSGRGDRIYQDLHFHALL